MDLTLVLGSAAVVLAFLVVGWTVTGRRDHDPMSLTAPGVVSPTPARPDLRARDLSHDASERATPMLHRLGARVRSMLPSEHATALARKIRSAGSPPGWTVERVLGAKVLGTVVLGGLFTVRLIASPGPWSVLLLVAGLFIGFFLPDGLLDAKVSRRKSEVRAEVAEIIDQLAVMVRAGISVDAAIVRTAQENKGPLGEELRRVVQDMRVGVSRTRALSNMAERVDVPELRVFVAALAQAEKLGVPVTETLRVQAVEMRVKQRQAAQELAMKLPVKILFPMVFCILPVIFVVLLGPAAIRIFDQLSK